MDGVDVSGEAAFLSEAFITYFTRKGRGRGRVNGSDVSGEFAFLSEAFAT